MSVLVVVLVALLVIALVAGLARFRSTLDLDTFEASFTSQMTHTSETTRIIVDGHEYTRLEDVPDPEVRRQLEDAIADARRERGPEVSGTVLPDMRTTSAHETRVLVNGQQYDSIDAVPDPEIRSKLRDAFDAAKRGL